MKAKSKYEHFSTITLALMVIAMTALLIAFPKDILIAASSGLRLWLDTVFPTLLPFFIGSELLLGLGVVNFIGVLLEPIMRPLFNVPGSGSFAMAMGFTSGYPMGAKVISRMRQEKLCTKIEAERLMSFCNNSGPLFMIGAVGVGMFNSPIAGYSIIAANYLGAITVGFAFRFYKSQGEKHSPVKIDVKRALREMVETRKRNGKTFGDLLSESVVSSVNTILTIGGYIVFFSVLIRLLNITGIVNILAKITGIMPEFLTGLVEITVGAYNISTSHVDATYKVMLVATLIAWGGLSAHAQIFSLITKTDISYLPFFLSKTLHAFFTFVYSPIVLAFLKPEIPVFYVGTSTWLSKLESSSINFLAAIALFLLLGLSYHIVKSVVHHIIR